MLEPSRGPATGGVLLVGSVPLRSAEEVFQVMAAELGDRVTQLPDGETGPRSDWIVWQYPVLSSRPEFEVCPPGDQPHRALPRLRVRDGESLDTLRFDDLGYAEAAISSYGIFARRKRDGQIPPHCRFQVSLPTPLAPIAAFVAPEDQARIEPLYEERMLHELDGIFDAIPHDQLAIQWDTNFEFAMLDEVMPVWFGDPRSGIVERLVRLGRSIPPGVQLGYHFCHGHEAHHRDRPYHAQPLVDVANALSLSLSRSLDWLHLPVAGDRVDLRFFETLAQLALRPETRLYLGLLHPSDGELGARARIVAAQRFVHDFGVATDCGWARHRPQDVASLIELHRAVTAPIQPASRAARAFAWPAGWERVPDDDWTRQPVDAFGEAYDSVDHHSWYRNLDATVEELSHLLNDGDILVDYSGGTGILLDRLKLRMFDARAGAVIVDSSPKFLRVALEKFRDDPDVGLRLLRFLKPEKRLQRLDEVLGPRAARAPGRRDRVDQRDPPVSRPGRHRRVVAASPAPGGPRADQLRQHPQPACPPQRVDPRRDRVGGRRPRRGPGAQRPRVRQPTAPTSTTRNAWRPTPPTATACSSNPGRWTSTSRPWSSAGLKVESVREASIEARVDDWYELLRTYHDAVLGWVGGTEKIDGAPPSPEAVADRLALIRHAMDVLFHGRAKFQACWTYITCVN